MSDSGFVWQCFLVAMLAVVCTFVAVALLAPFVVAAVGVCT